MNKKLKIHKMRDVPPPKDESWKKKKQKFSCVI